VCTFPARWCLLFEPFDLPVLGYLPLPVTWEVPEYQRPDVLKRFSALHSRPNVFMAFTYPFLALQHAWLTSGDQVPTASITGVTRDLPAPGSYCPRHPAVKRKVLVAHRPSLEYQEVLRRFQEQNYDIMSFRFVFTHTLRKDDGRIPLHEFVRHKAAVYWTYGVDTMLMHEIYATAVPLWVPADIWRWASHWGELLSEYVGFDGTPEAPPVGHPYIPLLRSSIELDVDAALYWSAYNEASRLPHVGRFHSIPDLIHQLETVSPEMLVQMSAGMNEWTTARFHQQQIFWQRAVDIVL